jgi:hypothetical protein
LAADSNLTITSQGSGLTVEEANVVSPDLTTYNGVIHEIDTLLFPPSLTMTVMERLLATSQFTTFLGLLEVSQNLTGLVHCFNNPEVLPGVPSIPPGGTGTMPCNAFVQDGAARLWTVIKHQTRSSQRRNCAIDKGVRYSTLYSMSGRHLWQLIQISVVYTLYRNGRRRNKKHQEFCLTLPRGKFVFVKTCQGQIIFSTNLPGGRFFLYPIHFSCSTSRRSQLSQCGCVPLPFSPSLPFQCNQATRMLI